MSPEDGARLAARPPKGPRDSATPVPLEEVFAPLVDTWRKLTDSYPRHRELFLTLLRTQEISNVKLILRAAIRGRQWMAGCWRPLGVAATLRPEEWTPVPPVRDIARRFARTPYARPIAGELAAHSGDLQAIELGLDRWISQQLFTAAGALAPREVRARALLLALVRERDIELLSRAQTAYDLSREMAAKLTTLLHREATGRARDRVSDWEGAVEDARRARRHACHLAFVGEPFSLAPPVALLMLRLDDVEIALRLAEARTRLDVTDLTRELAGG
jgi:vacuolar-type H+-ATPase subunit C/Vma6